MASHERALRSMCLLVQGNMVSEGCVSSCSGASAADVNHPAAALCSRASDCLVRLRRRCMACCVRAAARLAV